MGKKYGGCFDDELDAAKKVNQLCEEYGMPHKNTGISEIPKQQHEENQINDTEHTNPVISSEIANTEDDDDGATKNKRKREKDLIINDNSPVKNIVFSMISIWIKGEILLIFLFKNLT